MRFSFQFAPTIKPLFYLVGVTQKNAWAEVDNTFLTVSFGKLFSQTFPLENIAHIEKTHWPWYCGVGVKLARDKTIGVLASSKNTVRIRFVEPFKIKIAFGFSYQANHLVLSIQEADEFIGACLHQGRHR